MPPPTNTGPNINSYSPTTEDKAWMKRHHRIGWHPVGGWCRKMPGDMNRTYFGKVPPAVAVKKHDAEEKRRQGHADAEQAYVNLRVREAINLFLAHADTELATGKIGNAQRASYGDELVKFASRVGINRRLSDLCKMAAPEIYFKPARAAAMDRGVFAAEKHITQVRTFLHWCSAVRRFIPAPNMADAFHPPAKKEKHKATKAERKLKGTADFTADEVKQILDAGQRTDLHVYAQLLLMINGGMGATDVSELVDADVDWGRRCIHTDRSKTLVPRVVPLWDKTFDAMKASRAARREPTQKEWADRFFLTSRGAPLVTETLQPKRDKVLRKDTLKNWFYRLTRADAPKHKDAPRLPDLLKGKHRAGLYTLRSVFMTLSAGQPQDLVSVIAGQQQPTKVREHYLRGDLRAKLVVVCDHVRFQLWPEEAKTSGAAASSA